MLFLGKVIKRKVANQLQSYREEQDCLGPLQSGFRLQWGTETTLVMLQDDLLREADGQMHPVGSLTSLSGF